MLLRIISCLRWSPDPCFNSQLLVSKHLDLYCFFLFFIFPGTSNRLISKNWHVLIRIEWLIRNDNKHSINIFLSKTFDFPCLLPIFLWVLGFRSIFLKRLKLHWDIPRRPLWLILGDLDWLLILWPRMPSSLYHWANRWSYHILK